MTELGNGLSESFHSSAIKMFCEPVILNMIYSPLVLYSLLAIASYYLFIYSCFSLVPINTGLLNSLGKVSNNQIQWIHFILFLPPVFPFLDLFVILGTVKLPSF